MKTFVLVISLLALLAVPVLAGDSDSSKSDQQKPRHGIVHKLLLYIPNRVLDVLDIVRLRVRVGPGLAAGARVTKVAAVYVGSYVSVYAGLPGPRMKPTIPLPVGLESHSGIEASVVDATLGEPIGPGYSPTEVEVSVHPLLVGLDVGVDPVEIVDFLAGFLMIDIRGDDL